MNPSTPRRRAPRRPLACGASTLFAIVFPMMAHAAGNIMFPTAGVSDKPQSKVWYHDNTWWAAMNGSDRIGIYELAAGIWTLRDSVGAPVVPFLNGGTTDALWDGSSVYIAAFDSVASRLYKYTYVDSTRDYVPQAGFPAAIPTGAGSESISITKDSTGRLWSATETNLRAEVRYSLDADSLWSGPVVLDSLLFDDDIVAISSFGNRVGVLYSNQNDWAFYFRSHLDGDPPTVWSPIETIYEGVQLSDDHISLAADASGRLFAALKDQYDRLLVARRNLDGTWTVNPDITYGRPSTRPIVLVDDAESKLYCLYTRWPNGGHIGINPIEYRVANYNTLVFGLETVFIGGGAVSMNDVQSTKQRLANGSLLAICDGSDGNAYWNGWGPISGIGGTGGGGTLPAPPDAPTIPLATQHVAPGGSLGQAAYRFDEGAGTTSADASNHGNTATLPAGAAPDWTSGITGGGLAFNGINDVATVAPVAALSFTGSFTVECWMKLASEPDRMGLINKGGSTDRNYRLMLDRGGIINFSYKDTAGIERFVQGGSILDQEWHHVAGVRDIDTNQLRLYVDGLLVATGAALETPITSTLPVVFGARQTTTLKDYFHGTLDQVRLTPAAVYTDNFSPPVAFTSRPTRYVKLTWTAPSAQGGIRGYNVFRSINGLPLEQINGALLVAFPKYTDATLLDGFITYHVSAIDLLGQEGPQSSALQIEYESYDPLPPAIPEAYAVSRHFASGGVVAAYPLDETSGQEVLDAAGNNLNGVLGTTSAAESADPIRIAGISGNALEFDGSNDLVTIADAPELRIAGSMTIEAWFKLGQTGRTGALVAKGGSDQRNYRVIVLSTGKIEFSWDTTSGSTRKLSSTGAVTDLAWHHVACVLDAEAGQMRIYLDGVVSGSASATGIPITGNDVVLLAARRSSSSLKDWFKGQLDLVQIASAALYFEDFTPPTSLGSTASGGYVTLRWSLPQYGLVMGYNLYRSVNDQFDWRINRSAPYTGTTYVDETPHPGENCYWVRAVNAHGIEGIPTQVTCVNFAAGEAPTDTEAPPGFRGLGLHAAPNPFNPTTRVSFHLDQPGDVALDLHDVAGRRVRSWRLRGLAEGDHTLPLHASQGRNVLASGVYFLRLRAGSQNARLRLILTK